MPLNFELTNEQKLMIKAAREFAQKEFTTERAADYERRGEFPWDLYRKCGEYGYLGMTWPEEYGGQGLDLLTHFLIGLEFVRAEPTLAAAVFAGTFGADIIAEFGTEDQKLKWLPKLAKGEITSAGCFTEPAGGSDLVRILDTRAIKDKDGYWVINGTKTFITNGTTASIFITLVQTDTNVDRPYRGQTIFIIERGPGIEVSVFKHKLGWHASPTCEVRFNDVRVTDEDIVGGHDGLNRGFYMGMMMIDRGRLGVGVLALGLAEAALEKAISYCKEREAFGKKIGGFQGLAFRIVDVSTQVELLRSLLFRAIWMAEKAREDPTLMEESVKLSSMVKWFGARTAVNACDLAIDVMGGYGCIESDVERWYRFAKILEIFEGTKEIQKSTIARIILGREIVRKF